MKTEERLTSLEKAATSGTKPEEFCIGADIGSCAVALDVAVEEECFAGPGLEDDANVGGNGVVAKEPVLSQSGGNCKNTSGLRSPRPECCNIGESGCDLPGRSEPYRGNVGDIPAASNGDNELSEDRKETGPLRVDVLHQGTAHRESASDWDFLK